MALADDRLARLDAEDFDAWDHEAATSVLAWAEDLPPGACHAALREARVLSMLAHPMVSFMISVPAGGPGVDLERDASLAASVAVRRRTVAAQQAAGLQHDGVAELNVRLLDRICELIAAWPEPQWSETVVRRVEGLTQARRRGRERGQRLREARRMPDPAPQPTAAWVLRHPRDHWFRRARPALDDPVLRSVSDDWIAALAPSYATLAGEDWTAEEASGDLVVDVELPGDMSSDWRTPVAAVVLATRNDAVRVGAPLPVRRVPDADGPFNGTLMAILPGERWRVCAALQSDGSVLPIDGTRRLDAHPASVPSDA